MRRLFFFMFFYLAGCSGVFFYPQRVLLHTPAEMGLSYRDIYMQGLAGDLHGWFLPAVGGRVSGTVLLAHGNGENIGSQIGGVNWLPAAGFNILIFDYRGYGFSEGKPSPAGVAEDVRTMIQYLQGLPEIGAGGIVVYGHSLGGSAAISAVAGLESRAGICGLVVDSAFSRYRKIAQEKLASFWLTFPFQWLPYILITGSPDPLRDIAHIKGLPVLIMHGRDDEVVPFTHGQALYAAANEPKNFWWLQHKSHNQGMDEEQQRQFVDYLHSMFSSAACKN